MTTVCDERFEITVTGGQTTGKHIKDDAIVQELGPADISGDPLRLETAILLEDWLNNWDRLDIDACNRPLSRRTLTTIGKHLWHLVLDNEVGEGLVRIVGPRGGRRTGHRLRVLISFAGTVDPKLAGLPWEFLYGDGYFLAAESDLILTRYVNGVARPEFTPAREALRILFLAALPPGKEFDAKFRILALADSLAKNHAVDVTRFTGRWDSPQRDALFADAAKPFHVIHVVGLCRGTADHPEMYLPDGAKPDWVDPAPLVNLLTRGGHERTPKLVVLELCDRMDGDPTENFERLAPSIIRKGVPAVLAMQYPLPGEESEANFAEMLYDQLLNGMAIGEAVQTSRAAFADGPEARLFGTPVLYLQEDGVLVDKAAAEPSSTARASMPGVVARTPDLARADGPAAPLLRPRDEPSAGIAGSQSNVSRPASGLDTRGFWIRDKIMRAAAGLDVLSATEVGRMLDAIDWSADLPELAPEVRYVIRLNQDKKQLLPVFEEISKDLSAATAARSRTNGRWG